MPTSVTMLGCVQINLTTSHKQEVISTSMCVQVTNRKSHARVCVCSTGNKLHDNHDGVSQRRDADQRDNVRVRVALQRVTLLQECQLHIIRQLLATCLHGDCQARRPQPTTVHLTKLTLEHVNIKWLECWQPEPHHCTPRQTDPRACQHQVARVLVARGRITATRSDQDLDCDCEAQTTHATIVHLTKLTLHQR